MHSLEAIREMNQPRQPQKILTCIVLMSPVGKARARVTAKGTYTPQGTRDAEEMIRLDWARAHGSRPTLDASRGLRLEVDAYFPRPKTAPGNKRQKPSVRPDWDNIGKACSDALNGLAWVDDAVVTTATVRKRYCEAGESPRLEITVQEDDEP